MCQVVSFRYNGKETIMPLIRGLSDELRNLSYSYRLSLGER